MVTRTSDQIPVVFLRERLDGKPRLSRRAVKDAVLARLPNLAVNWASVESLQTLAEQLIGNIEAFVAGTPRNLV